MKRFNALKKVTAKPMTRQAYNDLRDWELPEDEDGNDDGYLTIDIEFASNVVGFDGYVSWSPKDMFENQFYEADVKQLGESILGGSKPSSLPNSVTLEALTALADSGHTEFNHLAGTLTHCTITLPCGFQVTGESACIDPANYNEELGQEIARKKALNALWPLEGYLLANDRYRAAQAVKAREGNTYEQNASCGECKRSYLS